MTQTARERSRNIIRSPEVRDRTYLGTKFRRFASRKGKKQAAIMVAPRILEAAYFILRDHVPYRELGSQYLDEHHKKHIIRHHVRRLESLGLHIDIRELPQTG